MKVPALGAPMGALALSSAIARAQDLPPPLPTSSEQTFPGAMNPSISFNGLFLGAAEWDDAELAPPHLGDEASDVAPPGAGETYGTGLAVQEMELQLRANVDPYFKANVVLAIPGTEGIEVEEGYVQLVSIPRILVTVGKLKEPFGRENLTHTHALLTVDKSLVGQRVFGEEGLNDVAVNAAWLMPTPWFSELTLGVDRGTNEIVLGSGEPDGLGAMAHWKNLFDLSSGTTLELGASGLTGANAYDGQSVVAGADVTLRSHGRGRRQFNKLVWQSEYLWMDVEGATADSRLGGLYSTVEYAITRRFWLGGRYDLVGIPEPPEGGRSHAATLIGVFAPSEFSAIRLQGQRQFLPDDHTVDSVVAQLNFTIGAHPAHAY
jgi:hypothetical protein